MRLLASVVTLALPLTIAACGGASQPQAKAAAPVDPAPAAEPHHGEHGDMPAPMVEFHEVLRPLWHDETPDRQAKTCEEIAELDAKAAPLATVEVAPEKKEAWTAAVTTLEADIDALGAACTGGGDFVATFTKVHDGFHALLEIAGGGHEEDGHGHGEEHAPQEGEGGAVH